MTVPCWDLDQRLTSVYSSINKKKNLIHLYQVLTFEVKIPKMVLTGVIKNQYVVFKNMGISGCVELGLLQDLLHSGKMQLRKNFLLRNSYDSYKSPYTCTTKYYV